MCVCPFITLKIITTDTISDTDGLSLKQLIITRVVKMHSYACYSKHKTAVKRKTNMTND